MSIIPLHLLSTDTALQTTVEQCASLLDSPWRAHTAWSTLNDETLACAVVVIDIIASNIPAFRAWRITQPTCHYLLVSKTFTWQTVRYALQHGAYDCLEKPIRADALFKALSAMLAIREAQATLTAHARQLGARMATLTDGERAVLDLLMQGHSNKTIAHQRHVATKTIDARRATLMQKLGVNGIVALTKTTHWWQLYSTKQLVAQPATMASVPLPRDPDE